MIARARQAPSVGVQYLHIQWAPSKPGFYANDAAGRWARLPQRRLRSKTVVPLQMGCL